MDEETKKFLEEKLNLSSFLTSDGIAAFYNAMQKYLEKKRIYKNALSSYIDETINLLKFLDLDYQEILLTIRNYPSILHADKQAFFTKYLLLAGLKDNETNEIIRKDILINHPKYLIIGFETLYARYKCLLEQDPKYMTKYFLLKMTNNEFENTFKKSKEILIAEYPIKANVLAELLDLKGNEIFKEKIQNENLNMKI